MRVSLDYGARRDLAGRVRKHGSEIADSVTEAFLSRHPDWLDRYGSLARERGIEDAHFHLSFLAAALESGSLAAFLDYGRWTAEMLASRGIAPHFVVENLEQIGEALAARLPENDLELVQRFIDAGMEGAGNATLSTGAPDARAASERAAEDPDDSLSLARSLYLQGILQGDKRAAMTVVTEALRSHPVTAVYRKVVEEAQVAVGTLWARNEITVAREHMATAVSQYVLGELYTDLPVPERTLGRAIITGVEGERHQLGANMVADLLEAEGWSVRFLGTQLPHRDIVKATEEHAAQAVGISATMLFNVPSVSNLIRDLRAAGGSDLRIIVGGRAFQSSSDIWQDIGADGGGQNLDEALEVFGRFIA